MYQPRRTVSDEEIVETVFRMLRSSGSTEAASVLRSGRWHFEETAFDNWNGGTRTFTLYIEVAAESHAVLGERKTQLEKEVQNCLREVTVQLSSDWYNVQLVPLIVAIPGRPDVKGGPVSRQTRKNIFDFLKNHNVPWNGDLLETDFLSKIFDLEALPSNDFRFKSAAGDIWQHRFMNDDWPENWVYIDKRFNLLEGPDENFLRFVEMLVDPVVRPDKAAAAALAQGLSQELRRDGWTLLEIDTLSGDRKFCIAQSNVAYDRAEETLLHSAAALGSTWMHQEIQRIEAAIDVDPSLAIGTAKDLIETCCRHIADRLPIAIPSNADMPELGKGHSQGPTVWFQRESPKKERARKRSSRYSAISPS